MFFLQNIGTINIIYALHYKKAYLYQNIHTCTNQLHNSQVCNCCAISMQLHDNKGFQLTLISYNYIFYCLYSQHTSESFLTLQTIISGHDHTKKESNLQHFSLYWQELVEFWIDKTMIFQHHFPHPNNPHHQIYLTPFNQVNNRLSL